MFRTLQMLLPPLRRLLGRPGTISRFHASSLRASKKSLQKFKLADIGEGITECEVIKWNVKPLANVQAFDPLCEVQSDKASVEITSPFDGVVKELLVKEGEVAKVGEALCLIEVEEEALDSVDSSALDPVSPPPHQVQEAVQSTSFSSPDPSDAPEAKASDSQSTRPKRLHPMDPNNSSTTSSTQSQNVLATPSVRHFARKNDVELGELAPGSGKDGRIEKRDVEAFLAGTSVGCADTVEIATPATGADVIVELGRTRYGMWKAMVKVRVLSKCPKELQSERRDLQSLEIPHFGYSTTLDLTVLHEMLPILNAHIPSHFLPPSPPTPLAVSPSSVYPPPPPPAVPDSGIYTRLTFLPILLRTLSKAMIEWPLLRSSITLAASCDNAKPTLTIRPNADISIALSTPTGLYTPTIQAVDKYSIYHLASRLKHLSHLGRQSPCALTPAEMPKRGGTVTVSNVGAIGDGDFASPVLVPGGGVAIVAVGRAKWVWDVNRGDGKGERRLKVGISWSADHRVVEGAELAAFVECWRGYVETPQRMIADGI